MLSKVRRLMTESAAFLIDDKNVPALRNIIMHIASIGYNEEYILKRLGLADLTELQWRALPIYRKELLWRRDSLDSLIDLFLLQGAIPAEEIDKIFDKDEQDTLIRTGLLVINEKCLARASLFPVRDRLVFSDHAWPSLPHPGCSNVPYDQVMSVGTDSRWLARATVRRPFNTALDLCAGSGIHALLAASHTKNVVAVDINPRAALCTRFNTQASGLANIETAVGDLYEPVGNKRFDLITANPPFVPSPVNSIGFRDGGQSGEDVLRRIVAGLPYHLEQGGIAQIVTELGERPGEALSDRLRTWLAGAPMDILILRLRVNTAVNYAIGHANGNDSYDAFLSSVHDWAGNLKAQGYTHVDSVLISFQWSDSAFGTPWTRIEDMQRPHHEAGDEIEALFHADRTVRQPDFHKLLECRKIVWAEPIGLMESCVLGSANHSNVQAKLFGKEFPIYKQLDPLERDILVIANEPVAMPELANARSNSWH